MTYRAIAIIRLDRFGVNSKRLKMIDITAIIILKEEIKRSFGNKKSRIV